MRKRNTSDRQEVEEKNKPRKVAILGTKCWSEANKMLIKSAGEEKDRCKAGFKREKENRRDSPKDRISSQKTGRVIYRLATRVAKTSKECQQISPPRSGYIRGVPRI